MMDDIKKLILFALLLSALSCRTVKTDQLISMPPPAVMDNEKYNPFIHGAVVQDTHRLPVLYATNRDPATDEDKENYYLSRRSDLVRLGIAGIGVAEEGKNWDDLTLIEENRSTKTKVVLEIKDVEEFGVLDSSLTPFTAQAVRDNISSEAAERFLLELRS